MKFAHLLLACAGEYWAMDPDKFDAMIELFALQASGIKFDADDIEAKIAPQTAQAISRREGLVAILPMQGVISNRAPLVQNSSTGSGMGIEGFVGALAKLRAESDVKTIVLDVNTPGGTVDGVDEAAQAITDTAAVKPVIAVVNATCASAGYWAVSGASEIVATPSARVGAIGVRTAHDNIARQLEAAGVDRTIFAAGKFKAEGVFGPLSEEAAAFIQGQVDDYYSMFVARVAKGRNVAESAVRNGFGQGRTVLAKDALAQGMIDRIGTMSETLDRFTGSSAAPQPQGRARAHAREMRALDLI